MVKGKSFSKILWVFLLVISLTVSGISSYAPKVCAVQEIKTAADGNVKNITGVANENGGSADNYKKQVFTTWGYSSSSSGILEINWSLSDGLTGLKGFEVRGTDRNGKVSVIDELPVNALKYKVSADIVYLYKKFFVVPYYLNGTERIYANPLSIDNPLLKDGDEYLLSDGIVGVKSPSQKQIKSLWKKLKPGNKKNKYKTKPKNKKPYKMGSVASSTLKNGINTLNFIRYVAGIPSNVKIKNSYQNLAQAAALVNYNDKSSWISHTPKKPKGMGTSLYNKGYKGSSSSNLAAGYSTLYGAICGWMSDSDAGNIDRVGHRRWCLNPSMKYTGFGIDGNVYAMYAFDKWQNGGKIHGVKWPAENTPLNMFSDNDAWSISMGTFVPKSGLKVTLIRKRDKKKWVFTTANKNKNGKFMTVENSNYGQKGCIIFRPKALKYKNGDKFEVKIKGKNFSFSYNVNFFTLK